MIRSAIQPTFRRSTVLRAVLFLLLLAVAAPSLLLAHCDTFDGPVVADARRALEAGDPQPVLKWVPPEHEAQIREHFAKTLTVRAQSAEARELADLWFFETLVRLHREGEGFPFTGIRPAGAPVEPVILAADRSLETGSGEELATHLSEAVRHGIHRRFTAAFEARRHAEESVEAGRRFVAAYVELTHYVEALDALAAGHGGHHGADPGADSGTAPGAVPGHPHG
jgi:hypothetical protein